MEGGMPLPWWEFSPADFSLPGSVAQPDHDSDEALLRGFLRAGALAETAACFLSANSLKVVGVLEALSRDELVLPTPEQLDSNRRLPQQRTTAADSGPALLGCRSRLYGLPLADRHAALNAACSLRHRLPRRALVNFYCRLILGKDVGQMKEGERQHPHHHHHTVESGRPGAHGWRGSSCVCGGRPLAAKTQRDGTGTPRSPTSEAAALPTGCRSCLARRGWMDPFSARMLSVACRKMLWDRALPDDEALALNRCLSALSEIIGSLPQRTAWPDSSRERDPSRSTGGVCPPPYGSSPQARKSITGGAPPDRLTLASTARPTGQADSSHSSHGDVASEASADAPCHRLPPAVTVGVAALLAGVRRRNLGLGAFAGNREEGSRASADHRHPGSQHSAEKRPAGTEDQSRAGGTGPPAKKVAKVYPAPARQSESPLYPTEGGLVDVDHEESAKASTHRPEGSGSENVDMAAGDTVSEAAVAATAAGSDAAAASVVADGEGAGMPARDARDQPEDCLAPEIRELLASVAEKVATAGARGATSADAQGAAAATVSLLQAAVSSSAQSAHRSSAYFQEQHQQPLKVVCKNLGLDVSRGKGASGCGDDLVMAVCSGFVTPALSLRNCMAFVEAVLVPRARSLSSPASRLLVTTVSGVGKTRPKVVIDGLIRPLLCERDQSEVGSAQCELCTRLIKQVLPKHTLEAVLVALCGVRMDEGSQTSGWGAGPGGSDGSNPGQVAGSCVWTELTMPVITAAVNLKPPLSENAIGVVVRRVEAAAELPELQKSLKFTTLVHGLVTRYGPQLKPFVPALQAAVGRCSNFMVKAVLAALQRLEK